MEPGTEKPPSSDAPSLNIRTVSLQSGHIESSIFTKIKLKTGVQAENQPDRSSSDATSSHSNAPQFKKSCYHQDGGESNQTSSVRQKLTSSSRRPGGTHFCHRKRSLEIKRDSKSDGFGIPKATLPQKTASTVLQGASSNSLSSLFVVAKDHLHSSLRENTETTSFFGIPTPPTSRHKYAESVLESGLTDFRSTWYGGYSGLHRTNGDPEGHVQRAIQMFDPLTPEPAEILSPNLPQASCTESNLSSAADAVCWLSTLEFSPMRGGVSFPSCLPNRNQTDDADDSYSTSPWGSRDTDDWSMLFGNASGAERDHQLEWNLDLALSPLNRFPASLPHSSDPHLRKSKRTGGSLTRCISAPSLSEIPPLIGPHSTVTQAKSLPNMHFGSSFEDFTPEITVELNEETFWFRCSRPGLYRCTVTGLVFQMTGDGVVVYRVVPWNRRLLAQYHKQPAGPLFDIKCEQRSVQQFYLPHCEIHYRGRCHLLSVAHVEDEGIEFITPQEVTETHIIINTARFSAFGIIKEEDSALEPVRALVLLFYRPPTSSDNSSLLNVLLLPQNVVVRDVMRSRKKLVGDERYIETSPCCKLQPREEYTLSTCPEDDTVEVQPAEAEFDCDNYDNFFPSFQVSLETAIKHMRLFLRDSSQRSVWERRVCLSVRAVNQNRCPSDRDGPSHNRLLDVRLGFIKGVSGPVLKSLLDKLFDKKVIADPEREEAEGIRTREDRARFVIDTVRKKGEAASSEMINILSEDDPFLCENLGLI